jgi:putative glutamine amidotransferase
MKKPLIAILGDFALDARGRERCDLSQRYVQAVEKGGGVPLVLPLLSNLEDLPVQAESAAGFLLPGGDDVHPALYGEEPSLGLGAVHPHLDHFHMKAAHLALATGRPLLAICRGIQVLNVALGGTLWQDLPSRPEPTLQHSQKSFRFVATHGVTTMEGSLIRRLLGTTFLVNSFHHQAIRVPGKDVLVTASAPDGIPECVEVRGHPFALGVQWHPEEMLTAGDDMLPLFTGLVEAARHFGKN